MKEAKELLKLIDDGNAIEILCKDNLIDKLNTLHEHELIDIKESTVVLTEKGKQAKASGMVPVRRIRSKLKQGATKAHPAKNWRYFSLLFLLVLLFLASLLTLI